MDKDKKGEASGWSKADFNDTTWKTTDPAVETWADLGLMDYFGSMWYRHSVKLPQVPAGKKSISGSAAPMAAPNCGSMGGTSPM